MKIKKLLLQNFKVFGPDAPEIDFCDELGMPNNMICIVGDNGSGKSTVLQAIAMLLGSATRRNFKPNSLNWPGFGYDFLTNTRGEPQAKVWVEFGQDEIDATTEFTTDLRSRGSKVGIPLEDREVAVRLDFHNNALRTDEVRNYFQFNGLQAALQLNKMDGAQRQSHVPRLSRVGGVYWYTEQRNVNSSVHQNLDPQVPRGSTIKMTDSQLRRLLLSWATFHYTIQSRNLSLYDWQRDRYAELNRLFSLVFDGRFLSLTTPDERQMRLDSDPLIWFEDGKGHIYELSNLSAGERAILPILIDFAHWEIRNSIILIDEVELHLHPPVQQALVRALQMLARDGQNQIIVTTHSDHVVGLFFEDQIIRVQ